ncbi:hypothetical protein J1605_017274 [Eschrichtius robustus]|uniref:Uncharacterized protein n=1 Tax=Eschrichtius robustus TaxID=9764 RepID=A0AB34I2U0_ESCRO|nr:hypothetical protein J1605_017274 [Eschrichtius robustus]
MGRLLGPLSRSPQDILRRAPPYGVGAWSRARHQRRGKCSSGPLREASKAAPTESPAHTHARATGSAHTHARATGSAGSRPCREAQHPLGPLTRWGPGALGTTSSGSCGPALSLGLVNTPRAGGLRSRPGRPLQQLARRVGRSQDQGSQLCPGAESQGGPPELALPPRCPRGL